MLRRWTAFFLCSLPGYLGMFLTLLGAIFLLAAFVPPERPLFLDLALLLLAAGVCLLLVTAIGLRRDQALIRCGCSVEGQILRRTRSSLRYTFGPTSLDGSHRAWILHYRYTVGGVTYTGRSRYLWKEAPALQQDFLTVYYDSSHPQRSALDLPIF